MLRGQDDLRIRTPFPADAPVDYMLGATPADALPLDRLTGYAPGTGAAYKYYYTQPTPAGWLTGMYTASGHSFTLDYRADSASAAVPYVGIWINNGETLIKEGICTIDTIIGTRDSIMLYLLHRGLPPTYAFKIMESVRKGKGLTQEFEDVMREHDVPEWYIASCKKIKYMFPKGHAVAYVMMTALNRRR